MSSCFCLIFYQNKHLEFSLKEGLRNDKRCNCSKLIIHCIRWHSHPARSEYWELLLVLESKDLCNGIFLLQIQLQIRNGIRLEPICGKDNRELFAIVWKRIKVCPVQHHCTKWINITLERPFKSEWKIDFALLVRFPVPADDFQVDGSKGFERIQGNAKLFKRFNLILVSQNNPEVACQIDNFRRIVEEQLLVPMWVTSRVN